MSVPETVRLRGEAAARCTAKIKRRTLRKQARKARAEHLVKEKAADRIVRQRAFYRRQGGMAKEEHQRHCDEVYTDVEETGEVQEK